MYTFSHEFLTEQSQMLELAAPVPGASLKMIYMYNGEIHLDPEKFNILELNLGHFKYIQSVYSSRQRTKKANHSQLCVSHGSAML